MKKTIFLTGATGTMGWAGLTELLKKKERFDIRILVLPSKKNRKKLKAFKGDSSLKVIWGDLRDYDSILEGVTGADYVLHVGGMVSPKADYYPEKTMQVNVQAAKNLVKAVLEQENSDKIKFVYVGSVAQYGDRMPPFHWGEAGDPLFTSKYDIYSASKCMAEYVIANSGLKCWVSLRQSGILYPGIFKQINPVALHVPVKGVLEWATVEDSGRLLANVVEDWVPDEFWNRFYNISSGAEYRLVNYDFENRLLKPLGIKSVEKVFEPKWFALKNFHGMWYKDADILEEYLHFRANILVDEYFKLLAAKLPWYYSLAKLVPTFLIKAFMRPLAYEKSFGTQSWITYDKEKLKSYYGSEEEFNNIKTWKQLRPAYMEKDPHKAKEIGQLREINKGYDSKQSIYSLSEAQIKAAAEFRGGEFFGSLGQSGERGQIFEWKCEHSHKFQASLEYVLLGGGWCPVCGYDKMQDKITSKNKFVSVLIDSPGN